MIVSIDNQRLSCKCEISGKQQINIKEPYTHCQNKPQLSAGKEEVGNPSARAGQAVR